VCRWSLRTDEMQVRFACCNLPCKGAAWVWVSDEQLLEEAVRASPI
jgi:hypothetical protein